MSKIKEPVRILIVEDYELSRNGLQFGFKKDSRFQIVGEAENGEEALALVKTLDPDIILMDIAMPVMDGIEATQLIKTDYPDAKVIMLTSRQENDEVYASLAAGADAYCMKDISTERLMQVIDMVADGAFWLDPSIAKLIMNSVRLKLPHTIKRQRYRVELTDREKEVLELLVDGKNNKEISETLQVSIHTAKAHVSSIMQKLAVDDRTEAAVKALREGIIKQR